MAYLTYLAVVPAEQVLRLRDDSRFVMQPLMIQGVSHLLSYWVEVQPLGQLLHTIVDGGETLHPELWHPLRFPRVHDPDRVFELAQLLESALQEIDPASLPDGDWLTMEIARLQTVLHGAVEAGAALVTALESPADVERAQRVRLPFWPVTPQQPALQQKWWRFW